MKMAKFMIRKQSILSIVVASSFSSNVSYAFQRFNSLKRPYSPSSLRSEISEEDEKYMHLAISHARKGLGHTFPNPAVGCVLVRQDTKEVIGSGFHPKAGAPHAEVFALLEAAGQVSDGVAAATSILKDKDDESSIEQLAAKYVSENGPEKLFSDTIQKYPITAYVTLEPCSHFGKTPPCAFSLVLTKVDKVIVGFRDPNPKVDGGGIKVLKNAGVDVETAEGELEKACSDLVTNFVKRITPGQQVTDYSVINGTMRRVLRSTAERKKVARKLAEVVWKGERLVYDSLEDVEEAINKLTLNPSWLETIDSFLWDQELVLLRLNKAIKKKKAVKQLGERVALCLNAHVAEAKGHTVLLYRPGSPPVLDLSSSDETKPE